MLSVSKSASQSLVQQKKQQWAREREEMSNLYLPWGSETRFGNRLQVRNQFQSSLELHMHTSDSSCEYQETIQRQRSPSLPPIHHVDQTTKEESRRNKGVLNRNIPSAKRFAFYDEDGEGDTSGYGSDAFNHRTQSGTFQRINVNHNNITSWQANANDRNRPPSGGKAGVMQDAWSSHSPRLATAEEGRPRWGDRGVATGRLWEPTAPSERLPQMQNQKKGTPSWVERGLNMIDNSAEILVIDQRNSINSGFDCDRSSCNGSDEGRSYIRGQNAPIEPEIKAERENKRIKALELQSAILNQLEDREKRRREEREIKLQEERLEELRLQRQEEEDRKRLEEEKRKIYEKQIFEQNKLETLKRALEDAERKAREEKEKRFLVLKQSLNTSSELKTNIDEEAATPNITQHFDDNQSPTKTYRTYDLSSAKSQNNKNIDPSRQTTEFNSPRSLGSEKLNSFVANVPVPPLTLMDNHFNVVPIGVNGEVINGQQSGLQLAVLVPQSIGNSLYSFSLNSLNNFNDASEAGKILTPRKYRTTRVKDASTQTDASFYKSFVIDKANETEDIDKDYSNIDENAPQESHIILKKDRRYRSEERFKKDLETRPKWGVNRPVAQYKKQSEKDPFYSQKRKMRHKYRTQPRQYSSQSSEDSRSPSPPNRSGKISHINNKHRNSLTQSYWSNKKSTHDLIKTNFSNDQNNDVQTDLSFGQITVNDLNAESKKSPTNSKLSPSKRNTLSQKFINDKYGNRKLWVDDVSEKNVRSNTFDIDSDSRKKVLDQINSAKKDLLDRAEVQDNYIIKTKL